MAWFEQSLLVFHFRLNSSYLGIHKKKRQISKQNKTKQKRKKKKERRREKREGFEIGTVLHHATSPYHYIHTYIRLHTYVY